MMTDYYNVDEVESAVHNLSLNYPGLCERLPLPHPSPDGHVSHALRISAAAPGTKDALVVTAGVHAREWGTCEMLVLFATDLLRAYSSNKGIRYGRKVFSAATVQSILNGLEVVVFPLVNPDGRAFSQANDAADVAGWRKNRNKTWSGGEAARIGVDLNRNLDVVWDFTVKFAPNTADTSTDPEDDNYCGPGAFSEAESRNVRSLLDAFASTRWLIDLHTGSRVVLYNWGVDANQSGDSTMNFQNPAWDGQRGDRFDNVDYGEFAPHPDNVVKAALATKMANAFSAVRNRTIAVAPAYGLYPMSGTIIDYAYARQFESEPRAKIHGFMIECDENLHPVWSVTAPIVDEVCAALFEFCSNVHGPA